jgi:hypothetical protein
MNQQIIWLLERPAWSPRDAGKMLEGFRGLPPVKIDRLAATIQAVDIIALLHPEIAEIDLNPIIISGEKPVVADALIVLNNVSTPSHLEFSLCISISYRAFSRLI